MSLDGLVGGDLSDRFLGTSDTGPLYAVDVVPDQPSPSADPPLRGARPWLFLDGLIAIIEVTGPNQHRSARGELNLPMEDRREIRVSLGRSVRRKGRR
jgi:hypothetical protein